jgi:hypothetical protein
MAIAAMARLIRDGIEFSAEIRKEGWGFKVYFTEGPRDLKGEKHSPMKRRGTYDSARTIFDRLVDDRLAAGFVRMTVPGSPYTGDYTDSESQRKGLDKLEVHAARLIQEELGIVHMLPYSVLKNMRVEADIDYHVNSLLVKLRTYLLRDAHTTITPSTSKCLRPGSSSSSRSTSPLRCWRSSR